MIVAGNYDLFYAELPDQQFNSQHSSRSKDNDEHNNSASLKENRKLLPAPVC
jgi:hypothetical protein